MFKKCIIACAFLAPCAHAASNISKQLMCNMTAAEFFTPLTRFGLIDFNAIKNEDSISYFRILKMPPGAIRPEVVMAFGMNVKAVFGYVEDQMLFRRGPGTQPPNTFGVVVDGSAELAKQKLDSVGAYKTKVRSLSNTTTEIFCEDIYK